MDICGAWQLVLRDLYHRADHHQVPFGPRLCDFRDQLEVDALVDDAVIADPRMPDRDLVRGLGDIAARLAEVGTVYAARKQEGALVSVALCLEQAAAPGEDDVGTLHEL